MFKSRNVTKEMLNKATEYLESEVKTYDKFLTGEVYGVVIKYGEEERDSCWGFYGQEYAQEYAEEEAPAMAEYVRKGIEREKDEWSEIMALFACNL